MFIKTSVWGFSMVPKFRLPPIDVSRDENVHVCIFDREKFHEEKAVFKRANCARECYFSFITSMERAIPRSRSRWNKEIDPASSEKGMAGIIAGK